MAKRKQTKRAGSSSTPPSAHSIAIASRNPDSARKAAKVLFSCELESIRLRSCKSESAEFPSELTGPFTLEFRNPVGQALGVSGPHLVTETTIDLESFDSSEKKNLVFRCSGTFQLEYHIEDGFQPTKEEMDAFAETFAVFNSWPYIRETLQSITQRMGFNPPPLPLLKLVPPDIKSAKAKRPIHPINLLQS